MRRHPTSRILACGWFGLTLVTVHLLDLPLGWSVLAAAAIGGGILASAHVLTRAIRPERRDFAMDAQHHGWWNTRCDTTGMESAASTRDAA